MDAIEARSLSDMAVVLENVGSFVFLVFGQATGATLRGEEGKSTGVGVMLPILPPGRHSLIAGNS